jgi:hypothetical protein
MATSQNPARRRPLTEDARARNAREDEILARYPVLNTLPHNHSQAELLTIGARLDAMSEEARTIALQRLQPSDPIWFARELASQSRPRDIPAEEMERMKRQREDDKRGNQWHNSLEKIQMTIHALVRRGGIASVAPRHGWLFQTKRSIYAELDQLVRDLTAVRDEMRQLVNESPEYDC